MGMIGRKFLSIEMQAEVWLDTQQLLTKFGWKLRFAQILQYIEWIKSSWVKDLNFDESLKHFFNSSW